MFLSCLLCLGPLSLDFPGHNNLKTCFERRAERYMYLAEFLSDHHDPKERCFENAHTSRRHASISLVWAHSSSAWSFPLSSNWGQKITRSSCGLGRSRLIDACRREVWPFLKQMSLSGIMMIRLQYHLELAAPLSKPHHPLFLSLSDEKRGSKQVPKSECVVWWSFAWSFGVLSFILSRHRLVYLSQVLAHSLLHSFFLFRKRNWLDSIFPWLNAYVMRAVGWIRLQLLVVVCSEVWPSWDYLTEILMIRPQYQKNFRHHYQWLSGCWAQLLLTFQKIE